MALIFSPISEDVLEGPFQPAPKSVFIMVQLGPGKSRIESDMDLVVCDVLQRKRFSAVNATSIKGSKDYLAKIIQMIRGYGFAVAIFSEFTSASTMGNIFFEVALCNLFGKPVLLVKSEDAEAPSDLVRSEWVAYRDGDQRRLGEDVQASVNQVIKLGAYYKTLGDIALEADEGDLELAFERYKQAQLITGDRAIKTRIDTILQKLKSGNSEDTGVTASVKRLRSGVEEFCRLLP